MAEKKEDAGSTFKGYGTSIKAVVRELNEPISKYTGNDIHSGNAVIAKDDIGEYVTSTEYVGKNLADPFRGKRIKPPEVVAEPVKTKENDKETAPEAVSAETDKETAVPQPCTTELMASAVNVTAVQ